MTNKPTNPKIIVTGLPVGGRNSVFFVIVITLLPMFSFTYPLSTLLYFLFIVCGLTWKFHGGLRPRKNLAISSKLVVGVNKYSHDTSCCIVDADNGKLLFAQSKERITREKHDGGGIGDLLSYALESIGKTSDDIELVVSNNHHHRVNPFEKRLKFYKAIKYCSDDYLHPLNILPNTRHLELSHHLAHAWSAIGSGSFKEGLILVMDGMGESYKAMVEDMRGLEENSGDYMHDLKLISASKSDSFVGIPTYLSSGSGYREAESAYVYDGISIKPIFKRWARERSPPELYNHGFENLESIGGVYSRLSSHIFGDWNVCGKVMGLAPWGSRHVPNIQEWYTKSPTEKTDFGSQFYHKIDFMTGNPFEEESFKINWKTIEDLEHPNEFSKSVINFNYYSHLASCVQSDLETTTLSLINSLKFLSGQSNLALVGGVALNSVCNGRILKESGFSQVFVPPAPGDEGVAIGCAYYGLHRLRTEAAESSNKITSQSEEGDVETISPLSVVKPPSTIYPISSTISSIYNTTSAYTGGIFSEEDIIEAIEEYKPYLLVTEHRTQEDMLDAAATAIENQQIIGWFQGRSEFGQRALGSRSILADPRQVNLRKTINEKVKEREWFRPLAPAVLDEFTEDWFEGLQSGANQSPFMSITAIVKPEKQSEVPAICHVDGTARLQTVTPLDNSLFHSLISIFRNKTGIPMVLNTSMNKKGQPIVETPNDAIATLMACKGELHSLFIGNYEISLKPFPLVAGGMAALASSPSQEQCEILIRAKTFYLSEVVAASAVSDKPIRVRIQSGVSNERADRNDGWIPLPATVHLELLQLLQVPNDSEYIGEGEEEVGDIYEALCAIRDDLSWQEVKDAIEWLYKEGLVSLRIPATGTASNSTSGSSSSGGGNLKEGVDKKSEGEDNTIEMEEENEEDEDEGELINDIDFEELFKGTNTQIIDLREPF